MALFSHQVKLAMHGRCGCGQEQTLSGDPLGQRRDLIPVVVSQPSQIGAGVGFLQKFSVGRLHIGKRGGPEVRRWLYLSALGIYHCCRTGERGIQK